MTDAPANRLPFPRPAGYDPKRYELLLRYLQGGVWDALGSITPMPNRKTDTNNNGGFSTDNIGMNYDYPDGDYATRERILHEHVTYQQGLMWFLANDPRVPEKVRDGHESLGALQGRVHRFRRLAAPAVRPRGAADDLRLRDDPAELPAGSETADDSVGLAAYTMDSHNCQRYVDKTATRRTRGTSRSAASPLPDRLSLARAAGSRVRQPAGAGLPVGLAHRLRIDPDGARLHGPRPVGGDRRLPGDRRGEAVQQVNTAKLGERLLADKQVLEWKEREVKPGLDPNKLPGIVPR